MPAHPVSVYVNWGAYDELADTVDLTEELAMREFNALLAMRAKGAKFDYYVMDAFWYRRDSGYRDWRKPHWPNGPEQWLGACARHEIKPGLWFGTNSMFLLEPVDAWRNSLTEDGSAACLFQGGFLQDFIEVLQHWYDRGIRMFKLDFADFDAATPEAKLRYTSARIRQRNEEALYSALRDFRRRNIEARFLAYNGFGGQQSNTTEPFRKSIEHKWLDVFDSLYCGDPRPADVPCNSFWRAKDIYSDHMVRQYEWNGIPLDRIDNCAFMIGTTATCYNRGMAAWKGMLLLALARGGAITTYYGNLEMLNDSDAQWFARVQRLFHGFHEHGAFSTFGGIPGKAEPYGYIASDEKGGVITVVNPSQAAESIPVAEIADSTARVLFHDGGFKPAIHRNSLTLGPEQMALLGSGAYAEPEYTLGIQDDIVIPNTIAPLRAVFEAAGDNEVKAILRPPASGDLRIVFQQYHGDIEVEIAPEDLQVDVFRSSGATEKVARSEHVRITHKPTGITVTSRQQSTLSKNKAKALDTLRALVYLQEEHSKEATPLVAFRSGFMAIPGKPMDEVLRISVQQAGRELPLEKDYGKRVWSGLSWAVAELRHERISPDVELIITCTSTETQPLLLGPAVYRVEYNDAQS